MRLNKYAMFAIFASMLMVISVGAVLFTEQKTEGAIQQETTSKYVGIEMVNGEITYKNEDKISGFDWDKDNLTLTMDGVNYVSTNNNGALIVGKDIPKQIKIVVKNENHIVSKAKLMNICVLVWSDTKIMADNNQIDKLYLESDNSVLSQGITVNSKLTIDNIGLDIRCYRADQISSGINFNKGYIDIKRSVVNVSGCEGALYTEGIRANNITDSIINIQIGTASRESDGLLIYESISNSVINVTAGTIAIEDEEFKSSTGLFIYGESVTISNSKIISKGNTVTTNAQSNGMSIHGDKQITFVDCEVDFSGYTTALCRGEDKKPTQIPLPTTIFSGATFIGGCKTIDGNNYEDIKSGLIDIDYKHITTELVRTVSYNLNGASGTYIKPIDVKSGTEFTVSDTDASKYGYSFSGWTDGIHFYKPGDKVRMGAEDITLKAVWKENPPMDMGWIIVATMFALLLIIGVIFARRDRDED